MPKKDEPVFLPPEMKEAAEKYALQLQRLESFVNVLIVDDLELLPHVLALMSECLAKAAGKGRVKAMYSGKQHVAQMLGGLSSIFSQN